MKPIPGRAHGSSVVFFDSLFYYRHQPSFAVAVGGRDLVGSSVAVDNVAMLPARVIGKYPLANPVSG